MEPVETLESIFKKLVSFCNESNYRLTNVFLKFSRSEVKMKQMRVI